MTRLATASRIVREAGILALLERVLARIRQRTYRWSGPSFGLMESVLFPDGFQVDLWTRYSRTVAALKSRFPSRPARWRVLEVGSGGPGLAGFMRNREFWNTFDLVVLDRDAHLLGATRRARPVLADALSLPFQDRSFDAVLAIDVLEHIPAAMRGDAARELRRVSRRVVICHCPVDGPSEQFVGRDADLRFREEFARRFTGPRPGWVDEHLGARHPTPAELREFFPGCVMSGDQNRDVWLEYMLAGQPRTGGASRFLVGYRYWRSGSRRDHRPPYRSALIEWEAGPGDPHRAQAPTPAEGAR